MKKTFGIVLAVVGGCFALWAGASLVATHKSVLGYDPVYAGLVGAAVFVAGLAMRQD